MYGVDLFAGAGGMSLGAQQAGVTVVEAVELNRYAAATYRCNFPGVNLVQDCITRYQPEQSLRDLRPLVVFGGPPCQGFSTSNQRTRSSENPMNWLFLEFVRIVQILTPNYIVFENVKGISETEGGRFLSALTTSLTTIGYNIRTVTLTASDFGVPQTRSRLFVLGSLDGVPAVPVGRVSPPITLREALSDLPDLENGAHTDVLPYKGRPNSSYARQLRKRKKKCSGHLVSTNSPSILERYKYIAAGGNWKSIPERLMANYTDASRCHTGIYRRLKWDEPASVIANFRKNMLVHPSQDRGLSIREAARIQSFPDSFNFQGSIGFQQQQLGNAVPPLLARQIFETLHTT